MAKKTLLEIVQDILNDISSDSVNSIDDTEESTMVAQIVRSTYEAMMSNRNWSHQKQTIAITPYSDSTLPTHMKIVENIKELIFLNYDKATASDTRKRYSEVKWLEPDVFLFRTNQENDSASNVLTVLDPSGIELFIRNDKAPTYYTSFDDETLVFDSYDSDVDSTLQGSKFQSQAYVMPSWTHTDDAVPDLPEESFSALIEEAKSKSAWKLKSEADQKAEQEATRQHRWLSRKEWSINGGIKYPNYGRTPRK